LKRLKKLPKLIDDLKSGVYLISKSLELEKIIANRDRNTAYFFIDGKYIGDSKSFFTLCSNTFKFPYESNNLDSFYDWLRDLSWIDKKRIIILFDNYALLEANEPHRFQIIINVFSKAVEEWKRTGRQGYIFLIDENA
jgi:RNAse (barnase) inhibitor barstar